MVDGELFAPRDIQAGVPQGSVVYSLCINDTPHTAGIYLALFVDHSYTHKHIYIYIKDKNVKSLCFNWALCYEGVWGNGDIYSSTQFLTSALDGGDLSASRSDRFTPKERAPDTHWIGGWVDPRTVLDTVLKIEIPSPRRESNSRTPII